MRLYSHALLAIAVAACATVAAIVDAAFVTPGRVKGLGDLYTLGGLSWPLAHDRVEWWTKASAFEPLAYLETDPQRAKIGDRAFVLNAIRASSGLLTLLPLRPVAGRTLLPSDHVPGSIPVTLISSALSARAFASHEQALGATVQILGIERRVVGVMTTLASYRNEVDVWLPRTPEAPGAPAEPAFRHDEWIGRLRSGISAAEAHDQLVSLQKQLAAEAAGTNIRFDGVIVVRPLLTDLVVRGGRPLTLAPLVLTGICLLVFSWIQVLRPRHPPAKSGRPALPHAADRHRGWISAVRHPITCAIPAIALGGFASWFWEQDAVALWFHDLLPQSAGTVELAVRGGSAVLTAAVATLLGVAVFGCGKAVAALRGRPGTAIPARLHGRAV
jgi:hypothetical protein